MKNLAIIGFCAAAMFAKSLLAETAGIIPNKSDLISAMNRRAEENLDDYIKNSSDYVTGHIHPVKSLSEVLCVESAQPAGADCHFLAIYGSSKTYHIATLIQDSEGWHILRDQSVSVSTR
ncbi:hypothetical protein [Sphingomonas oryzagri]|uniref:DUF3828 domain-containing protein n=1 Tax=Sphingomonas oryzagri TaxID=3042314 RepID=A0ABT6N2W0_9SPHN|nr:hypothetical protein [Sphingomonas oryzagri]MDH7639599.1 hypothetical protein [Sphingomonas oryzagri]